MNWLLLRGLAREQRHWGRFVGVLRQSRPNDTVHCLDLAGTGTEVSRKSPSTIAGITEDVRARLLELKRSHPGPWSLLGVSLGGMVSMQWVASHPEDFERVVLINTSASNLSVPWRRMRLAVLPKVLRSLLGGDELTRQKRILSITARMVPDPTPIAAEWAEIQRTAPVARTNVLRQLWAAARYKAPERLAIPTLILAGAEDPLCDPDCPKRLSQRFGAPLDTHPRAGHDLAVDDPEWLSDRIEAWISGTSKRAA